ncbi:hypothetical protein HHI36_007577 [Cryptolaemus montrouzieri]|uniref:Peptidase aspartic putative domain-containing protein n=1 Tax=Cryptolaemus montrouzieri TaxID=559131 RepID=A0ABD2MQS7_9CUCU
MVDLTLKKAEEMCHIHEESRKQTVEMGGSKEAEEEQQDSNDDSEEFLLNSISLEIMNAEQTNNNKNKNELVEHILINNVSIGCKIDTDAQSNLLPTKLFEDLSEIDAGRKYKMQTANVNLIAYGGTKNEVVGSTQLNCIIRS